jgi:ABC-type Mn2+/Zn2+ transport system permease subunit
MLEILQYTFMQRAVVASILIGIVCALIGVYVVLRGLAFIGAGIAHASFGGVALGFLLGINPLLTAVFFCLGTAWGISYLTRAGKVREDTAVGIFFASTMALGILIIGILDVYNVDLFGYLFGSVLAVTRADIVLTIILSLVVLGVVILFYKEFLFVAFDPEMAAVAGLPVKLLDFFLVTLIALTVVVSLKVVGIILVAALLVTPAAAAYQLTSDFHRMMLLSICFGVGSALTGLILSTLLDTPSGATMVLTATLAFFLAVAFSPKRRRLPRKRFPGRIPH